MKLTNIKTAIVTTLRENFSEINIYSPDVKEGFKKPSFFVQLLPVLREQQNKAHYSRNITVVIYYYSEDETELENLKMQDQLEVLFGQTFKINNRVITIDSLEGQIIDNVLQFSFDISYLDSLEEDKVYGYEEAELMQELILEEE